MYPSSMPWTRVLAEPSMNSVKEDLGAVRGLLIIKLEDLRSHCKLRQLLGNFLFGLPCVENRCLLEDQELAGYQETFLGGTPVVAKELQLFEV